MKRTPLKKISEKKLRSKDTLKKLKEEMRKLDIEFYMSLWKKRCHFCYSCLIELPNTPSTYNFDHLLEKSKFPELRHVDWNIGLLCLDCHNKKTAGFINERYKEYIIRALENYKNRNLDKLKELLD